MPALVVWGSDTHMYVWHDFPYGSIIQALLVPQFQETCITLGGDPPSGPPQSEFCLVYIRKRSSAPKYGEFLAFST